MSCPSCGNDEYVYVPRSVTNFASIIYCIFSAVYFQDQSKRKETRMILFFVCTKCNHSFTDPTVRPQDAD